ncbi:S-methyl-5'-thioadenosine phosphorylase [Leptospira santarosai]|nr:S-methyl-5'-thioadenosine phosphorylase [Leptospira santarosai]
MTCECRFWENPKSTRKILFGSEFCGNSFEGNFCKNAEVLTKDVSEEIYVILTGFLFEVKDQKIYQTIQSVDLRTGISARPWRTVSKGE